ncbi:hypothetical protein EK21DRAFT_90532 [Setomelanomma holmii]|uniref:Uncharacterized protein n=1 Tax=Setomelanomma holmii TaxID=210430 RepID=A0A9P4LM19_9PLEO|nr:hypothetical protein EK21DRAFT_90532 [Setomelanomma holmii]
MPRVIEVPSGAEDREPVIIHHGDPNLALLGNPRPVRTAIEVHTADGRVVDIREAMRVRVPVPRPFDNQTEVERFNRTYWSNLRLLEYRQARALAGLDTTGTDEEITRRILSEPNAWGELGYLLARRDIRRDLGVQEWLERSGEDR